MVCDGRISGALARHHEKHGRNPDIRVVFSGINRSADDLIVDLVDHSSFRRRITVITNDIRLGQDVRRLGARVDTCAQFLHGLASDIESAQSRPKPRRPEVPLDSASTATWLEFFGFSRDGAHPTITPMLRSLESNPAKVPSEPVLSPAKPAPRKPKPKPQQRVIDPDLVKLFNECGLAIDLDDPDLLQWLGTD